MAELLFIRVLNMSLTASIVILAVLAVRLILRKAPGIFSYCLWAVVLFRLLCPISFTAVFSPLNALPLPLTEQGSVEYIPETLLQHDLSGELPALPQAGMETSVISDNVLSPAQAGAWNGAELLNILTVIWLAGILVMALYSIITLIRLKARLKTASWEKDNIYITEAVATPFVLGLIRPRIYLPVTLGENEGKYVLLHEQIHIKRKDHLVKAVSFAALCLHWFNPFVWAAFFLSGKDMEMSCDEAVLRKSGKDMKKEYSTSLLCLSTGKRIVNGIPLAFGEGDAGSRIKNILRYQKPAAFAVCITAVLCAIMAIVLLANPTRPKEKEASGSYLTFYGIVTDVIVEDSSRQLLLCPGIGEVEIPAAETVETYFEPGDERDPHQLLPGDLVAVTFDSAEDPVVLDSLWPAKFSTSAQSITIMWQGLALEDAGGSGQPNSAYRLTFPGGVVTDALSASPGDILSLYREEPEDTAYLPQIPESDQSRLIVSTPVLAVTENEAGGQMLTIELSASDLQQTLAGFGFYIRFTLEADDSTSNPETSGNTSNPEPGGSTSIPEPGGSTSIPETEREPREESTPLPQAGGIMDADGVYSVGIQSLSRSTRVIDRYTSSYKEPYDGTEPLAFGEDCEFMVNYQMDTLDYEAVSFDVFADLISAGSEWQISPCRITLKDGVIQSAALDSALLHYGISFDRYSPSNVYGFLLENGGDETFETYYSLVSVESADIADSPGIETIEVYTGNIGDGDSGIVLFKDASGELLYTQDAHVARVGWNNIYLGERDGTAFLMNVYVEDRWDFGGYGYWVYRLGEDGSIRQIAGSRFDFELSGNGNAEIYDDDLFREWSGGMTAWLEDCHLLLSTQECEVRTDKVSDADRYNYDTLSLKDREL